MKLNTGKHQAIHKALLLCGLTVLTTTASAEDESMRFVPATPDEAAKGLLGYVVGPPFQEVLKNAIRNPDGSYTIPAGKQAPAVDAFHKASCMNEGGVDTTNESEQRVSTEMPDVVNCLSRTPMHHAPNEFASPSPDNRLRFPIMKEHAGEVKASKPLAAADASETSLVAGFLQIIPRAPNGNFPYGTYYSVTAEADFKNLPYLGNAALTSVVLEDGCSPIGKAQYIGPGDDHMQNSYTCLAKSRGTAHTNTGACFVANCVYDHGVILHN